MKLKDGVVLEGLKEPMQIANCVADAIWKMFGEELVITSGLDGEHMEGSKHYTGDACDYRTRYFDEDTKAKVFNLLCTCLGEDYDIVWHSTHIHVEHDPDTTQL